MATFDQAVLNVKALTQQQIVAVAKSGHQKIWTADPRPLNFTRYVDANEGAPEESVKPGGVIVYDYNRLDIIAKDALDLLRRNSPVKSGEYVQGHTLYLNLQPVEDLRAWKPGDEISITNTVPYSRVIELGMRGGIRVKFSMPPHIYERVASALRREYRDIADIGFTFRAVLGQSQIDQQKTASSGRWRRGGVGQRQAADARHALGGHNKAEVRWPTIIIKPASILSPRSRLH